MRIIWQTISRIKKWNIGAERIKGCQKSLNISRVFKNILCYLISEFWKILQFSLVLILYPFQASCLLIFSLTYFYLQIIKAEDSRTERKPLTIITWVSVVESSTSQSVQDVISLYNANQTSLISFSSF